MRMLQWSPQVPLLKLNYVLGVNSGLNRRRHAFSHYSIICLILLAFFLFVRANLYFMYVCACVFVSIEMRCYTAAQSHLTLTSSFCSYMGN